MESNLVTSEGTRVLTVKEYDQFITNIPKTMKSMFEISVVAGLKYIELQNLYDNPHWYDENKNQIKLYNKDSEEEKICIRTINKLPPNFPYTFKFFVDNKRPPYRSSWNKDLTRWSMNSDITPKIGPKTPRRTIESWMLDLNYSGNQIYSRLGYDPSSIYKHCRTIQFTKDDHEDIYQRLKKWKFIEETFGNCYFVL